MKPLANNSGFTLVEILVSFFVLTLAVVTTLSVYSQTNQYLMDIQDYSEANQILNKQVERLRKMSLSSLTQQGSTFTDPNFSKLANPAGTVVLGDPYGDDKLRRLELTLNWTSVTGRDMSAELVTYITERGLNSR